MFSLSLATLYVLAAAITATFACRFLGMLLAGKFSAQHPFIRWSSCVAYSVVMAFTVKILIFPESDLQNSALLVRGICLFFAIFCFFLFKRSVIAACLGGTLLFGILPLLLLL